jgi:Na+/melibiose symporter-like transporter
VQSKAATDRKLDLPTKLFYGFGSVAFGVKDNGFSYMLLFFYSQVVGLPTPLVALALTIALIWDAMIDPLIGQLSDNLKSPWGRRHPFMYAAALPVALSYFALWNPPHWGQQPLFLYLVAMTIVIRTFTSFYEVPSSALAAEFTTDYDERSVLLSYRFFFGWVGGLTVNFLAFAILLIPDKTHKFGQMNPVGYAHYGLFAAAIMFAAILISTAGTHRYIPGLRQPPARRHLTLRQTVVEMAQTLSNRSLIFLLLSSVAGALAAGLVTSLNLYFNTYFWEFSARQISLFTLGVFASPFLALTAVPALSRRFGKRAVTVSMTVLSLVFGLTPLLLRVAGLMPPNHSPQLVAIIFCTSVIGTAFSITSGIMGSSMVADVVEAAELKTGRRSEGLIFAASAFIGKATSGFGILAASAIVAFIHLKAGADPSSVAPSVVRNLALVYCPVLILLFTVALTLLLGYRITRASHEETVRQLAAEAEEAIHPLLL